MSEQNEDLYQCVGVCMADPDSGICMGCGRPPLGGPDVAIEVVPSTKPLQQPPGDPDSPA